MDAYGKIENLELFPLLILTFFSPILNSKFSITKMASRDAADDVRFLHVSSDDTSRFIDEMKNNNTKMKTKRPEVEFRGTIRVFEGKYGYLLRGQITTTDFRLLLDMQKRTYCNKICDKAVYYEFSLLHIFSLVLQP
jgi:hypothetical protein